MVMSRAFCGQVVPHVLAAWLVAFLLTVGHACLAHGHHEASLPGAAVFAQQHDAPAFPIDCERFCNDNTPLSDANSAPDLALTLTVGFLISGTQSHFAPVESGIPGRLRQTEPAGAVHFSVLQRSQRLAL